MYSYKERIKAVELYIKLGRKASVAVRMLGYPSKKYLRQWVLIYDETGDLPKNFKRKPTYTTAQKQAVIDHYLNNGQCFTHTQKVMGYPCAHTFNKWHDELKFQKSHRRKKGKSQQRLFSKEEKKAAVIELCTRTDSADALAKNIGVSRESLYIWKDQLLPPEYTNTMANKNLSLKNANSPQLEEQLKDLHLHMHKLQLEHDILKKANDLLKKEQGISHERLTNQEKTTLIDALRDKHCFKELLKTVKLPRSSYFYHKARRKLPEKYKEARESITDIFNTNYQCYGYRRIHAEVRKLGISIAEKVIRRLMQEENLIPHSSRKRRQYNSYYGEISPPASNLINRDFHSNAPNTKWLTDISEFQIPAGKVYLSPIVDCFDGMVVSWKTGKRPNAELVNTMLDDAIVTFLGPREQPIVHSDRGGHYRWERTDSASLTRSMSRKGYSPDNAACEGFFGRLKTEFFYPRDWSNSTLEHLMAEIDNYIKWYNLKRIKISLGAKSPIEYRL
ncbi:MULTISPECIES: IS3 family transposase [Alteromonadaceae]|uniref:IS3 family transposase n=1 Tax=Paraglaciecola chathamensis TaxID=368405 RepID=UPI00177FB956|nr:IS3 family transposase [Paraglaciecola oceanifecundans]